MNHTTSPIGFLSLKLPPPPCAVPLANMTLKVIRFFGQEGLSFSELGLFKRPSSVWIGFGGCAVCVPEFRRTDSSSFNFQPRLARWCHRQTRRDQLSRRELTSLALLQALIGHLECSAPANKLPDFGFGRKMEKTSLSISCLISLNSPSFSTAVLVTPSVEPVVCSSAQASFTAWPSRLTLRPRSARAHGPGLGSGHGRQRHLVLRNTLKVFPNLGRETDHSKVSHEVISLYQSTFQEMVCKSPCGLQMHGCAIRSLFLGTVPAVTNHSTPSPFWFVLDKLFVTHTLIPSCARLRSLHSAFHRFALGWTSTKRQRIEVKVKRS